MRTTTPTFYRRTGKRLLDLFLSVLALPLLAPLLVLLAALVRLKHGSPVFFRQQRPGFDEHPFTMIKFRTMTNERDATGELLPDSKRLTRLGRFLRTTSLDELPQLLNVMRGQMSLIGPRPLLMKDLPYCTEEERKRFDVLPGITGLAQINGRNELPWDQRLAYDAQYAEQCTLGLDLRILWRTIWMVLRRKNVQADRAGDPDLAEERGPRVEHQPLPQNSGK
jgi:lipopolysaccharide/colanic/teichoic acid biosynthesis glycosyltransferase